MNAPVRLLIAGMAYLAIGQTSFADSGGPSSDTTDAGLRVEYSVAGGRTPRLSSSDSGLLLSWQQVTDKTTRLNYVRINGDQIESPRTAVAGENWLVNYADYASIIDLGDGHWLANWYVISKDGLPDYHFKVAQSFDSGNHWRTATTPFTDEPVGQQGFVSALSSVDGVLLSWIGSRENHYALYTSRIDQQDRWLPVSTVDADNCSCCHPDMAQVGERVGLVYRDRTEENIRDIAISFQQDHQWTEPQIVAADNWEMNGCPVNGPVMVGLGADYTVAWFSAPSDEPMIRLKLVTADGRSRVLNLEGEHPLGYLDAVAIDVDSVLIAWLSGSRNVRLNLQQVNLKRLQLGAKRVLPLSDIRLGFPSLAVTGERLWIAYESVDNEMLLLSANVSWIN